MYRFDGNILKKNNSIKKEKHNFNLYAKGDFFYFIWLSFG